MSLAAVKWWVPCARERLSFTEVILLHALGYSSPNALHMTLDPFKLPRGRIGRTSLK